MEKKCRVCGKPIHPQAYCCPRCKKLIDRVDPRGKANKEARISALKEVWDGQAFRCHYTDVRLVESDSKSPLYISFDHRIPRDERDVVVTSQVLNDMKSDLSEDEFKAMVMALAKHFCGESFDSSVMRFKYWKR